MSHTPLDGPDGGSRDGETAADEASTGVMSSAAGRVRHAVGRVLAALRQFLGRRDGPDAPHRASVTDVSETTHPVERSVPLAERDDVTDPPVVADRRDERPVPASTGRGPRDRPELVARWHDDRLTLSEPDQAGAQISSDTWSEVDP